MCNCAQLSDKRNCTTYQGVSVGIDNFADEDVYPANRDDGEFDCVLPSKNLALVRRNDRKTSGIQNVPHGDRVADA
jgi:hypothetical protein